MTFDINGRCEFCQETIWFCFCDIDCPNCEYWEDHEKQFCECGGKP